MEKIQQHMENHAMTVAELIERLKDMPEDAPVVFAYDYGDHWHSQVAPCVSDIDEQKVKWSDYHGMPKIADHEDDDDNQDTTVNAVVIS